MLKAFEVTEIKRLEPRGNRCGEEGLNGGIAQSWLSLYFWDLIIVPRRTIMTLGLNVPGEYLVRVVY